MVPPSVWGWSHRKHLLARAAHVVGLLAGGCLTGGGIFAAGRTLPSIPGWLTAAWVVGLAFCAAGVIPLTLTGSKWRVPREWAQIGVVPFAGIFGLAVGTGIVTALASPGFYYLLFREATTDSLSTALTIGAAFAMGRTIMFLLVNPGSLAPKRWRISIDRTNRISVQLGIVEGLLLAAAASVIIWNLIGSSVGSWW